MSIFRRKLTNTAAAAIPAPGQRPIIQPGPTTVHHHGVNWPLVVFVAFLCIILLGPVSWWYLVYLFGQLGSRSPGADAAGLVLYGGLAVAFLVLVSWRAGPFFDSWLGYKTEVQRELTRREELKLLAAQTTLEPGRMNEEDFRFARVILAVMMVAFEWLEKNKLQRFPARWRPWSKSETLKTAEKIGVNITQDKALSVAKWLADEGIITAADSGQIAPAYSTLSSVRAHLDNKFGKPIVVVSTHLRDNRGFKFTE